MDSVEEFKNSSGKEEDEKLVEPRGASRGSVFVFFLCRMRSIRVCEQYD